MEWIFINGNTNSKNTIFLNSFLDMTFRLVWNTNWIPKNLTIFMFGWHWHLWEYCIYSQNTLDRGWRQRWTVDDGRKLASSGRKVIVGSWKVTGSGGWRLGAVALGDNRIFWSFYLGTIFPSYENAGFSWGEMEIFFEIFFLLKNIIF